MGDSWRALVRRLPPAVLWLLVWGGALAVPRSPAPPLACAAAVLWLSAFLLAAGRPQGRRLVLAAAGVWLFWAVFIALAALLGSAGFRRGLDLAVWLPLGLHLLLAHSPLRLALAAAGALAPALGPGRARRLALSLALLGRLPPVLLASALSVREVLNRRAAALPPARKLALWGRAAARDALNRDEDLARSLAKRWPWPDF